ncbi:MAG: ABC transporter permease [Bacteroidales bacterium]|nr:ABC transporter permease [Bacteroidales bacterium]
MSDLYTPVSSMPEWARLITCLVSPRYFIEIMRAVYLKDTLIQELGFQYTALTVMAVIFCLLATLTYKKQS